MTLWWIIIIMIIIKCVQDGCHTLMYVMIFFWNLMILLWGDSPIIFTRDCITCENYWWFTPLVTTNIVFNVSPYTILYLLQLGTLLLWCFMWLSSLQSVYSWCPEFLLGLRNYKWLEKLCLMIKKIFALVNSWTNFMKSCLICQY